MNKAHTWIDEMFRTSLLTLIPIIILKTSFPMSLILALLIVVFFLGSIFVQVHLRKYKKEQLITNEIKSFIRTKDYSGIIKTTYDYPIATFFIMKQYLTNEEILNLQLHKLNHKEFKPDKDTICNLLAFLDTKKPSFREIETEDFLNDFIHFNLNFKN